MAINALQHSTRNNHRIEMMPIIYLVDDDDPFRMSMDRLLRASGYDVVAFKSPADFLASSWTPDAACILLELRFPSTCGIELQNLLHRSGCPIPTIFLTGGGDVPTIVKAMKGGAFDVIEKAAPVAKLLGTVRSAIAHHQFQQNADDGNTIALLDKLTAREREVFSHVIQGWQNKRTAHSMQISERTVKAHRQQVMRKLHAGSLVDLVSRYGRHGFEPHGQPETPLDWKRTDSARHSRSPQVAGALAPR